MQKYPDLNYRKNFFYLPYDFFIFDAFDLKVCETKINSFYFDYFLFSVNTTAKWCFQDMRLINSVAKLTTHITQTKASLKKTSFGEICNPLGTIR